MMDKNIFKTPEGKKLLYEFGKAVAKLAIKSDMKFKTVLVATSDGHQVATAVAGHDCLACRITLVQAISSASGFNLEIEVVIGDHDQVMH